MPSGAKHPKSAILPIILTLVTLGQMSINLLLPSLPAMGRDLQANDTLIQLSISFFLISFACAQLFYGPLSDIFGRRKIILYGLALYIVATIAASLSTTISFLLAMRLLQGLGIAATNVLCRAIMRDSFKGKEFIMVTTYITISWSLVGIFAPLIGGYIQFFAGWRSNFGFLALFNMLVFALIFFKLPETRPETPKKSYRLSSSISDYITLITDKNFIGHIAGIMLLYAVFTAFNVAAPFLLQNNLKLSTIAYSWMHFFVSLGLSIGLYLNSRLIKTLEIKTLMLRGLYSLLFISLVMLLIAFTGIMNIGVIVLPMFLIFLSSGFLYANCAAKALAPFPHMAGSASAMLGFLCFSGGTLSSMAISFLPETNQFPLSATIFFLALIILIIFRFLIFNPQQLPKNY